MPFAWHPAVEPLQGRKKIGFLYAIAWRALGVRHGRRQRAQRMDVGIPIPRPNALVAEVATAHPLYNLYKLRARWGRLPPAPPLARPAARPAPPLRNLARPADAPPPVRRRRRRPRPAGRPSRLPTAAPEDAPARRRAQVPHLWPRGFPPRGDQRRANLQRDAPTQGVARAGWWASCSRSPTTTRTWMASTV